MTAQPRTWHVESEYVELEFVGYVLRDARGQYYGQDDNILTWLDVAKAEADCAALNAGGEL